MATLPVGPTLPTEYTPYAAFLKVISCAFRAHFLRRLVWSSVFFSDARVMRKEGNNEEADQNASKRAIKRLLLPGYLVPGTRYLYQCC